MQTKNLMKLVLLTIIIIGIAFNACKKSSNNDVTTPVSSDLPTKDTAYCKVNGGQLISPIYAKSQTATQVSMSSFICGVGGPNGISFVINKAGLQEGQTYDKSIFSSALVQFSGIFYTNVTSAQIKIITLRDKYFKITFSMVVSTGGTSPVSGVVTEGVLELIFP